jgi:hypothetical protein
MAMTVPPHLSGSMRCYAAVMVHGASRPMIHSVSRDLTDTWSENVQPASKAKPSTI